MSKNMAKTLKIVIVLLIIIAIIIGIIIYINKKNEKVSLNDLPELEYTEDEAKEFYTKTLIKHLSTFQNDFYLKYTVESISEDGTKTVTNEEFSKKGEIIAFYYPEKNQRIVIDNENFYHINENSNEIYKTENKENISNGMDILFYSLKSINNSFVKSGNEILNGEKYYFEEYTKENDKTVLLRYYFDENDNIKYIKSYKDNSRAQTFFTIEMLENRTYDFMFDMGDKYEILNG